MNTPESPTSPPSLEQLTLARTLLAHVAREIDAAGTDTTKAAAAAWYARPAVLFALGVLEDPQAREEWQRDYRHQLSRMILKVRPAAAGARQAPQR